MSSMTIGEPATPFQLIMPERQQAPFVLGSPHSGKHYSPAFLRQTRLDKRAIRKSEDFFIDELFSGGTQLGIPMLAANFPRAFLDANREPYELDPKMFDGKLPPHVNANSPRVANGLGTIASIVSEGEQIYPGKIAVSEAMNRIENYYKPYHQALGTLMAQTQAQFGLAILIDCHSMPSSSVCNITPNTVDFVLGDRYGSSCSPVLTDAARHFLEDLGYCVSINKPFAGGFITRNYGRPNRGLHALQIEINRNLYMDEKSQQKTIGFQLLQKDINTFLENLLAIPQSAFLGSAPLAAE